MSKISQRKWKEGTGQKLSLHQLHTTAETVPGEVSGNRQKNTREQPN
jgi:hypothetical protein